MSESMPTEFRLHGVSAPGSTKKPRKSIPACSDNTKRATCSVCGRQVHIERDRWLHSNGRNYKHTPTPNSAAQVEGLDLDLERVKAQNAAMREALQGAKSWIWSLSSRIFGERRREDYINSQQTWSLIMAALQSDVGRDYIAKESVRPLVEALRKAYTEINTIHARCGVPWWDTGKSDVAQEYFTSVVEESRSALDVARQLGLP